MKQTIKLNERELKHLIKESVKRVLKEAVEDMGVGHKKEVFTISAYNIQTEESIIDMPTSIDYDSEEEAVKAARNLAKTFADNEDVVIVTVFGGEYETPSGIFGEPYDIYTISNKDRRTTMIARKEAGYVSGNVDEYVGETDNKLDEAVTIAIRKYLN